MCGVCLIKSSCPNMKDLPLCAESLTWEPSGRLAFSLFLFFHSFFSFFENSSLTSQSAQIKKRSKLRLFSTVCFYNVALRRSITDLWFELWLCQMEFYSIWRRTWKKYCRWFWLYLGKQELRNKFYGPKLYASAFGLSENNAISIHLFIWFVH